MWFLSDKLHPVPFFQLIFITGYPWRYDNGACPLCRHHEWRSSMPLPVPHWHCGTRWNAAVLMLGFFWLPNSDRRTTPKDGKQPTPSNRLAWVIRSWCLKMPSQNGKVEPHGEETTAWCEAVTPQNRAPDTGSAVTCLTKQRHSSARVPSVLFLVGLQASSFLSLNSFLVHQ